MWPFTRKPRAPAAKVQHDRFWFTGAARRAGVLQQARQAAESGSNVLIVCHFAAEAEALRLLPEGAGITVLGGTLEASAVHRLFAASGPIAMVLAGTLKPPPTAATPADPGSEFSPRANTAPPAPTTPPVVIVVPLRHVLRTRDDAVVAFASAIAPPAEVRFHAAFDEPPLTVFDPHGKTVKVMQRLGMDKSGSIDHPFLDASLRKGQLKIERIMKTDSPADSIEEWVHRNTPSLK